MKFWLTITTLTAAIGACAGLAAWHFTHEPVLVSAGLAGFVAGVLIRVAYNRWRTAPKGTP